MYNPVNARVSPSRFLTNSQYGVHVVLLVVSLASIPAVFYHYLLPLFVVQAWHFHRLYQGRLLYLQTRHWRFHNGQWTLQVLHGPVDGQVAQEVEVDLHHLWPSLAIFRFNLNGRWRWEIIYRDAVDAESFRQMRAVLNLSNKRTINTGDKHGS